MQLRTEHCREVLAELRAQERQWGEIDLIVLAFRKLLAGEMLDVYRKRIINVHPAELSVYDLHSGQRRYIGISGLALSLCDGHRHSRTSIHYVDSGMDSGELICLGPLVEFDGNPAQPGDIYAHEQQQKRDSDIPALTAALTAHLGDVHTSLPIVL